VGNTMGQKCSFVGWQLETEALVVESVAEWVVRSKLQSLEWAPLLSSLV
jgi:hypothetical protein